MVDKSDLKDIVAQVVASLRPEIIRVLELGPAVMATDNCCEGYCPCNERNGGTCPCNSKCSCEGKTSMQTCMAMDAVSGLPIDSIRPEDWNKIYENLLALEKVRVKVLGKK